MLKKYLVAIIITSVIILLPAIFGIAVWDKLPEKMPSHFGASGEADGYASRAMVVFGLPAAMALLHIICIIITLLDPKRKNIEGKPFALILVLTPAVSTVTEGLIYAYAFGYRVNITSGMTILIGALFMLLGNWLPKCGHNYTLGIRTPWTLNDEENWRATHRFAGKAWFAAGILVIILGLVSLKYLWIYWVALGVIIIASVSSVAYSYVYYLKHVKDK